MMKLLFGLLLALLGGSTLVSSPAVAAAPPVAPPYFTLTIYHFQGAHQEALIDSFLQHQYLPVLHAAGVPQVGVFKPLANDTAADKRVVVFTPFASLRQWERLTNELPTRLLAAGSYANAPHAAPAFTRQETIFLKAFPDMEAVVAPQLATPKSERVYELRSYEGATEKLYRSKVRMFNAGGEIKLFKRLGFNALFYGEVLAGTHMPNLMYLTTFANKAAREAHWQAFGADAEWKRLSALPEYQNTVSHMDITFLRPTPYSDL